MGPWHDHRRLQTNKNYSKRNLDERVHRQAMERAHHEGRGLLRVRAKCPARGASNLFR